MRAAMRQMAMVMSMGRVEPVQGLPGAAGAAPPPFAFRGEGRERGRTRDIGMQMKSLCKEGKMKPPGEPPRQPREPPRVRLAMQLQSGKVPLSPCPPHLSPCPPPLSPLQVYRKRAHGGLPDIPPPLIPTRAPCLPACWQKKGPRQPRV